MDLIGLSFVLFQNAQSLANNDCVALVSFLDQSDLSPEALTEAYSTLASSVVSRWYTTPPYLPSIY